MYQAEDELKPVTDNALEMHQREIRAGFTNLERYTAFGGKVKETKRKLFIFLVDAHPAGKIISYLTIALYTSIFSTIL